MEPIINFKKLLLKDGRTLLDLAFRCDDFDGMWELALSVMDESRSFISRIVDMLRLFEMISDQKSPCERVVEYSNVAIRMIDYVEENYALDLTLQVAAEHFGYSKQYFCKWCKSETGVGFNKFLNAVRIHHACAYLADGCPVEEASERCGFSDPSYFAKVFRKFMGVTPKAYAMNVISTQK